MQNFHTDVVVSFCVFIFGMLPCVWNVPFSCHVVLCEAGATSPMNKAFSYLYSSGFWLSSLRAKRVCNCFFHFLASYQRLAHLTLTGRKNRFQMIPKLHYLCHVAMDMKEQASNSNWAINCLAFSVQIQEDFVGRPSRVSRRVNIRRLHRNVMFRSLVLANRALAQADRDERGMDAYSS